MSQPADLPPEVSGSEPGPTLARRLLAEVGPLLLSVPVLTVLAGVVFPIILAIAGCGLFPHRADGSLVTKNGVIVGSELIGQRFAGSGYFQSRPSAAGDGYDPLASGGSN